MANINIKYKGLTGLLNDLTIDNGQTMTQLRTAIIADEGSTELLLWSCKYSQKWTCERQHR
jgi:hypothetical protein